MNSFLRNLDSTNVIRSHIPQIIDAFVNFYGEEYRAFITQKFNDMIIIGYYDINTLKHLIFTVKKKITDELLEEVFQKLGIPKTKENIERYMGMFPNFEHLDSLPIFEVVEYIELRKKDVGELISEEMHSSYELFLLYIPDLTYENFCNHNLSPEQLKALPPYISNNIDSYWNADVNHIYSRHKSRIINDLASIYPDANLENVDELIQTGRLDYLIEHANVFREAASKYNVFIGHNLQNYIVLSNKLEEEAQTLLQKYYLQILSEFKEYLNPNDQINLEKAIRTGVSVNFECVNNGLFDLSGYQSIIEYFDLESDKKLMDPAIPDYQKYFIKTGRIKYFKYRGINLGENYEDYEANPKCREIWPNKVEIDKIKERIRNYLNKYNIELYSQNPFYLQTIAEATNAHFMDNDVFDPYTISQGMTCVNPNIVQKNGECVLCPMIYIFSAGTEFADVRLIHELNHVLELSLREVTGDKYSYICGWDCGSGKINQNGVDFSDTTTDYTQAKKRDYELFSEIINELLAQRICRLMHESGTFILDDENNYKIAGGSSYEKLKCLVRDFVEMYLEEIIASRRDNNIGIILNRVGEENFNKLNELINEFAKCFPGFTFHRLMTELQTNQDTELTRKFNAFIARRNEILQAMREYSLTSHTIV